MGAQAVRLTNVDIDNALKNKHFEVVFQPLFNLEDGSLLRFEAFVRWVHPGLGVLPPGAFVSFFENQGRMKELTRYVINAALELNISGYESSLNQHHLLMANEIWLSNAIQGMEWVNAFKHKRYYSNVASKLVDQLNKSALNL